MTLLILLAIVLVVCLPSIMFGYITDDIRWVSQHQQDKRFSQSWRWLRDRLYGAGTLMRWRKCQQCSGTGSQKIAEIKDGRIEYTDEVAQCNVCQGKGKIYTALPLEEHALAIGIHLAIVATVAYVMGLPCAMLYALHPACTSTALWLNGRRYAIATIVALLAFKAGVFGGLLLALSAYFMPLAAPLLFTKLSYAPFVLVAVVFWVLMYKSNYVNRLKTVSKEIGKDGFKRGLVVLKCFGWYVSRAILPGRTMMQYAYLQEWGVTEAGQRQAYEPDAYLIVGSVSLIALASLAFVGDYNALGFIVCILPWCGLLPTNQILADRYLSLANVFMMALVASIVPRETQFALAGYYASRFTESFPMFVSIESMFDWHNYFHPANIICRKLKANWLLKTDKVSTAWEVIKEGLKHKPNDFTLLYLAAIAQVKGGEKKHAKEFCALARKNKYLSVSDEEVNTIIGDIEQGLK